MRKKHHEMVWSLVVVALYVYLSCSAAAASWKELASPDVGDRWVQPAQGKPARPVWGHTRGLRVGVSPMPGPRGLLRIYTPYLGHSEERMINFIAVEPIPKGAQHRGFSELEMSSLDKVQGKRMWSADNAADSSPKPQDRPARGVVGSEGNVETLTVFVFVEPFQNGAHVFLRLTFRSDRPDEAGIATFACDDSVELDHCILTATMGNYARLRTLHLNTYTSTSLEIWPNYKRTGFAPHARFPLKDLIGTADSHALFIATPNEKDPSIAQYSSDTLYWWKYYGKKATQYWRCENPDPKLEGLVNGRYVYWASNSPIPGGISFENFELCEPFRNGAEYWFGVTPKTPEELRNIKGKR